MELDVLDVFLVRHRVSESCAGSSPRVDCAGVGVVMCAEGLRWLRLGAVLLQGLGRLEGWADGLAQSSMRLPSWSFLQVPSDFLHKVSG